METPILSKPTATPATTAMYVTNTAMDCSTLICRVGIVILTSPVRRLAIKKTARPLRFMAYRTVLVASLLLCFSSSLEVALWIFGNRTVSMAQQIAIW